MNANTEDTHTEREWGVGVIRRWVLVVAIADDEKGSPKLVSLCVLVKAHAAEFNVGKKKLNNNVIRRFNTATYVYEKNSLSLSCDSHRSQLVSPTTSSFVVFLLPVDASTEILSSQPCTVSYVKKEIAAIGVTLIAMGTMPQ